MAFGSWIKNITKKIGSFVKNKVIPIVKKVGKVVKDTIAPSLSAVGNVIGGKYGDTITKIGNVAGNVADKSLSVSDKIDNYLKVSKPVMRIHNVHEATSRIPESPELKRQQLLANLARISPT